MAGLLVNGDLEAARGSLSQPIDGLLNTNTAPSLDGQIDSMRRCLFNSKREALTIEAEIQRTKQYLEQLEVKRQGIHDYIVKQTTVLNPVRRIPSEVLSQIFREYNTAPTVWYGNQDFYDSLTTRSMQWVLSHVCLQWRTVAFSLSSLWSQIHVALPSGFDGGAMLLGVHLQRSRSDPLSVFIKGQFAPVKLYSGGWKQKLKRWHPIITTLLQHAYRWQKLQLCLRIDHIQEAFSYVRPLMPSLHSLIIRHTQGSQTSERAIADPSGSWALDVFRSARNLHFVKLEDIYLPHRVLLPWDSLVHLYIFVAGSSWKIVDLLNMLVSAARLQCLALRYHFIHEPDDTILPFITLPCLHTLIMCWFTQNTGDEDISRGGNQLLDHILVHRLRTFQHVRSVDLESICSMHERSGRCPIQCLSLTVSVVDDDFLRLLDQFRQTLTVLRLRMENRNINGTLITSLTYRMDSEAQSLPRLRELYLTGGMEFDAVSFVAMVESRMRPRVGGGGVSRFSRITLNCMDLEAPENLEAFDRFGEDECFKGMEWSFKL
ncbi:hypothetical protein Moror_9816 [Moniliophthora roreri MCA 2997]|uniref:Uncharacterized protein n=2 Tax=Moniliophthora roreri TaxID=221103 RepID=V2X253_MONRO|nr:hypothetical protein Moror_9816 [Moniliophthora roreri MCA 2997]